MNGPAAAPLASYPAVFDGVSRVKVLIPGLGYSISAALIAPDAGNRLQLGFRTVAGFSYRVEYCTTLTGAWASVLFALSAAGPVNQTRFTAANTNATIFVLPTGPKGFYRVVVS